MMPSADEDSWVARKYGHRYRRVCKWLFPACADNVCPLMASNLGVGKWHTYTDKPGIHFGVSLKPYFLAYLEFSDSICCRMILCFFNAKSIVDSISFKLKGFVK